MRDVSERGKTGEGRCEGEGKGCLAVFRQFVVILSLSYVCGLFRAAPLSFHTHTHAHTNTRFATPRSSLTYTQLFYTLETPTGKITL